MLIASAAKTVKQRSWVILWPQKPSPNRAPTLGIPPFLCCPGVLFARLHATNELVHVLDALLLHELAEPGDNM